VRDDGAERVHFRYRGDAQGTAAHTGYRQIGQKMVYLDAGGAIGAESASFEPNLLRACFASAKFDLTPS